MSAKHARFGWSVALVMVTLPSSRAVSQPTPLDPVELQANALTTGDQRRSSVAVHPDGSFVVVWSSWSSLGSDTSQSSVQARRFSAAGVSLDQVEFQINTYTTADQDEPAVVAGGDGGFLVVWSSYGSPDSDTSGFSIQARRFAADGTPIDPVELQVNSATQDHQLRPSAAMRQDGGFVVSWTASELAPSFEIRARRFAPDGTPLDLADLAVNTYTESGQMNSSVDVEPDGDFVVAWDSGYIRLDHDTNEIRGRRFSASGTPVDAEDLVLQGDLANGDAHPTVKVHDDGEFLVVWSGKQLGVPDIWFRRFGADGAPLDPDRVQVNTDATAHATRPAVAVSEGGDFVVAWERTSLPRPGVDPESVRARRFRLDGVSLDDFEFQLNAWTPYFQVSPGVGVSATGDFVATWSSSTSPADDSSAFSVQLRRFRGLPVFSDGFESGDAGRWSLASP